MAKITRKHQKIFTGAASVTGVVSVFGSKKAGAIAYSNDVATLQSLGAWGTGWADAIISNYAPTIQDLNAMCRVFTSQLAYVLQNGVPLWNAETTYYIGSIVSNDADSLFISLVDTNLNQALTDYGKWHNLMSRKVTTVTSLDYTVLNVDWYVRVTATAGITSKYVILPGPAAGYVSYGRQVIVKYLQTESPYHLEVKSAAAETINGAASILLDRYQAKTFVYTGSEWTTI
jgi:hypothetical protein